MPKDRRVTSSSVDRCAIACPYSRSPKTSDLANPENLSPHADYKKECEEARCPICLEHPHNAVLLLCSSREKGCRPFICDTSYRHSNCLDQFRKSVSPFLPLSHSQLVCPLCRGRITGWEVVGPARTLMNSKARNCSLETCEFNGNYVELRKHARTAHPYERPSEPIPSRQSEWSLLERQMEMEDILAHQSDGDDGVDPINIQFDLDETWTEGSFFDFPSGMSDIGEDLINEMFSGLNMSFMSLYSPGDDLMDVLVDSGSSRSTGVGLVMNDELENDLGDLSFEEELDWLIREHEENNGQTGLSYRGGNEERNEQSRSSHRRDPGFGSRSRWSDQRSRSSYSSWPRWSGRRSRREVNVGASSGRRSRREENGWVSWPRMSDNFEDVGGSSGRWSYREGYSRRSSRERGRSRHGQPEGGGRGRREG